MIGLFEPVCAPWNVEGVPDGFSFGEMQPDWDRMGAVRRGGDEPRADLVRHRHPQVLLRPGELHARPAADRRRGARAAQLLRRRRAELDRHPHRRRPGPASSPTGSSTADPTSTSPAFNIDRLHTYQANPEYRRTRTVESLGMVYQCHYPTRSMQTARGAKRSPLHDRLAAAGRVLPGRQRLGGRRLVRRRRQRARSRPADMGPAGVVAALGGRAPRRAASGVIVMDMSFMSKFRVQGRDAGRLLDHLSANAVDGEPGRITYTQWLNEARHARGRPHRDQARRRASSGSSPPTPPTATSRRWMRRHIGEQHAFVTDVTSGYAQINVQGPRSRELLQSLTIADLSNEAFPFRAAREIDIGFARVLCVRITYLGELGYELYMPAEQAVHVYDRLVDAGRGVRAAPRRAEGARQPAHGEGLPRLRPRHRQHRHRARGRARLRGRRSTSRGGFIGRDAVPPRKQAGPPTRRARAGARAPIPSR